VIEVVLPNPRAYRTYMTPSSSLINRIFVAVQIYQHRMEASSLAVNEIVMKGLRQPLRDEVDSSPVQVYKATRKAEDRSKLQRLQTSWISLPKVKRALGSVGDISHPISSATGLSTM